MQDLIRLIGLTLIALYPSVVAAGHPVGYVQNGYTWQGAYWLKGGYRYYPGKYGYPVKDGTPSIEQRLLDIKQQQVQAEGTLKLAESLGLTQQDLQAAYSQSYAASSYGGVNPLLNAAYSGQTTLYGNGATVPSATQYVVSAEASFDQNAQRESTTQILLQLAKVLGTGLDGSQAVAQQFAQIASTNAQAATTIAEKQEGTKQMELLLQALVAVQPKDKAAVNVGAAAGGGASRQPAAPDANVFSLNTGRGLTVCKSCHTAAGATTSAKAIGKLDLDQALTADSLRLAMGAVVGGSMPPAEWQQTDGAWRDADTSTVLRELIAQ